MFLKYLFVWNTEWQRKRKTEREKTESMLFTGSLPKCPQQPGLYKQKAEACNSKWVSHVSFRVSSTWTIILCLPGCLSWKQLWKQRWYSILDTLAWDAVIARGSLTLPQSSPLKTYFFFLFSSRQRHIYSILAWYYI